MMNICESCFNDYETINSMQSLVSVNSGLMKCILGSCDITRRNRCGPRQGERCLGLEAANVCNSSSQFSWVGRLLSKVNSELLQDFKAYHQTVEEGYQICVEQQL
jgi:hypothetical protein